MTLETRIFSSVLPPVLLLAGLGYFVLTDRYIQKIHKRTMTIALALIPTAVLQDVLDYCLTYVTPIRTFRLINSAYGYMIYMLYCEPEDKTRMRAIAEMIEL